MLLQVGYHSIQVIGPELRKIQYLRPIQLGKPQQVEILIIEYNNFTIPPPSSNPFIIPTLKTYWPIKNMGRITRFLDQCISSENSSGMASNHALSKQYVCI